MTTEILTTPELEARAQRAAAQAAAIAAARKAHRAYRSAREAERLARRARSDAFRAALEVGVSHTELGRRMVGQGTRRPLKRQTVRGIAAITDPAQRGDQP